MITSIVENATTGISSRIRREYRDLPLLGNNLNLVFDGDSVTAGSLGVNYTPFVIDCVKGSFNLPSGYNQGVGSQTTDVVLADISTTLALNPKIVCIFIGGNDLRNGTRTFDDISSDLRSIYDAIINASATVVTATFYELGDGELTPTYEAMRLQLNEWIKSQRDIFVADLKGFDKVSMLRGDGVHPNYIGAKYIGERVGNVIKNLSTPETIFAKHATDENILFQLNQDYDLSGTGGIVSGGVTGEVADGWICITDSDATINCTKDGNTQVITVSGSNTTAGTLIQFRKDIPNLSVGQDYWAALGVQVVGQVDNVAALALTFTGATANASVTSEEFPDSGYECAMRTDTVSAGATTERFQLALRLMAGSVNFTIRIQNPMVGEG